MFSTYYQNVRGLRTKLDYLRTTAPTWEFDIIAFSETWLTEDISSAELGLNNYSIFRCDGSPNTSQFSRGKGRGVLIAQDRYINFESSFSSVNTRILFNFIFIYS